MVVLAEFTSLLLTYMVGIALGIALLLVIVIVAYMFRKQIKMSVHFIWAKVATDSYTDYMRREEAEKGFKERGE